MNRFFSATIQGCQAVLFKLYFLKWYSNGGCLAIRQNTKTNECHTPIPTPIMGILDKEPELTRLSYYEASVTRPAASQALEGSVSADVCVVGGGYAGLSAALELAERGYSVVLLEARMIGWGADGTSVVSPRKHGTSSSGTTGLAMSGSS